MKNKYNVKDIIEAIDILLEQNTNGKKFINSVLIRGFFIKIF